ncbi:hypothetical protein F0160_01485 [Paraburkholderia sp. JPY303]|uniref:hypothetical protein n=1 Tax=Paraburkholderia atlantica TaxID=2654982 RepID=UPI0015927F1B|nr:hypothetical protein [Paraburkholderia atlantica]
MSLSNHSIIATGKSTMSDTKPTMPRRGDFGWQPLVSAFEPTIEDMMSNRAYFGMPPEALYLWGTFRDEDGEIYCPMRRVPAGLQTDAKDTRRRFYLCTTLGHQDGMHMHPVGKNSVPNDGCSKTLEGERIHWRSHPQAPGNRFHVTWTPDECSWYEENGMDIEGRLVKPGMHWYLPGRDAGMYYVANIFEMEGTILGKKVRGMIGFDPIYMYEGGEIYKTKDALVQEKLELIWYTWATRYKDGSIDFGHFTLGNDMFGFAILGNEKGEVRYTYDVTGKVDFGANGYWQEGIQYSAFGDEWEFIPDPKGRLVGLGTLKNPQVDGRWRRVGDTREPDVWFAWGEAAPEHGDRPVNRLPDLGTRVGVNFRKY